MVYGYKKISLEEVNIRVTRISKDNIHNNY